MLGTQSWKARLGTCIGGGAKGALAEMLGTQSWKAGLGACIGAKEPLQKCWEHSPIRLNLVPLKPQYPRIWQSLMIPHLF